MEQPGDKRRGGNKELLKQSIYGHHSQASNLVGGVIGDAAEQLSEVFS